MGATQARRGFKTREAGDSIKPGVERSGTPGSTIELETERAKRATARKLIAPLPKTAVAALRGLFL
jgi:hypothetical protein